MCNLRIWETEAGGMLQIQGQARQQHEILFQNTKKVIENNKKYGYRDSLRNEIYQFWMLFSICMGYIKKKKRSGVQLSSRLHAQHSTRTLLTCRMLIFYLSQGKIQKPTVFTEIRCFLQVKCTIWLNPIKYIYIFF